MSDPREFEGVHIPTPLEEERHALERRVRDMAAWTEEHPEPGPVTYSNGTEVPEPPPLYPGEDMATFWVARPGSLAAMLTAVGAPKDEERWACEQVWKPGSLTLVVGAQQSFKSWAMFDLMFHATQGTNWLEHPLCDYDAIFYVSNEKSKMAVYERLWLMFHSDIRAADKVYVKHREDRISFGNGAWQTFVEEVHGTSGRLLIILDTLTSLAPAGYDENNLKDVSRVLQAIRDLQDGSRMDILLVHHLNAMGERPRGHTALDGEVDGFVKFDRRGRDQDEVMVRFEPKDGLPSVGTYTFDGLTGLFKRSQARSLHIGNLVGIVAWYQERNGGEGITVKEMRERFFNGYRYDQLQEQVDRGVDELRLKRELKRSMLTNREANIITVMPDEEREAILSMRRRVADIETETEVRVGAELRAQDMLDTKSRKALAAMPEPVLFPEDEAGTGV
jgi:hypothetical protein